MGQVHFDHVRKVYDNGYEAVKDFNLTISDGEFVVLVGPSGCGKSTTLRMLAGLEDISAGSISIDGTVVNAMHPKDRDIAMVFQNYALYPHMSVYKNMAFALQLRKIPKDQIDRRVRQAAATLGIDQLLDRKPRQLSGGQRQRVAVGRAIVREPKAFLFDEPLSNLDARLRVSTRAELKTLHMRLKTTTIYVTHDQEEAMTLGDRIVVMAGGVIQQADSPFKVYDQPVNRFVASFMGMPPMNFFEGTLEAAASGSGVGSGGVGGGGVVFNEGSVDPENRPQRIALSPEQSAKLRGRIGQEVVLGIRPQGLYEAVLGEAHLKAKRESRLLYARVEIIEPLGSEMDARLSTGKHPRIVARIPMHAHLRVNQIDAIGVDLRYVHVFEPGEFGRNLTAT